MNRFVVSLLAFLLAGAFCLGTRADDGPAKPPELKVLERLVGTWESDVIAKPAEWTPKEVRTKGTLTREWVLNGRFLQEKGIDEQKPNLCMFTYDVQKKAFRFWRFDSEGGAMELSGQWDEASKTMLWKAEMGNGLTSIGPMRFIDADTIHWEAVTKDKAGKVYMHLEGKVTRKK
jgi:hypothetical protein